MKRKMYYSLYKNYYNQYPASDYDSATKTIMVDLPDIKQIRFPKNWERGLFCKYVTPGGCRVYAWGSGVTQSYLVECPIECEKRSKTIPPGVNNRQNVIDTVNEFEREKTETYRKLGWIEPTEIYNVWADNKNVPIPFRN